MSDTWGDIQEFKNKQSSLREKIARKRKERQELEAAVGLTGPSASSSSPGGISVKTENIGSPSSKDVKPVVSTIPTLTSSVSKIGTTAIKTEEPENKYFPPEVIAETEKRLLVLLDDITLTLPVECSSLISSVSRLLDRTIPCFVVEDLLQKFVAQTLISLNTTDGSGESRYIVETVDHSKLSAVTNEVAQIGIKEEVEQLRKRKRDKCLLPDDDSPQPKQVKKPDVDKGGDAIENLLSMESAKQRESKKMSEEILTLLSKPTAKEQSLIEKFKSQGGAQVKEFCPNGTKEECMKVNGMPKPCDKLHFRKILHKHTDESLGDCSFLNTCFHMDTCKYVHYEIDYPEDIHRMVWPEAAIIKKNINEASGLFPAQWVQCDVRNLDMSILGKFAVIMADPPWDIHMELPYGTMSDDEMRKLQIPILQDDGYIFLWVTGRAMELGRECLRLWGYERVDELIWVKTNQLQRIIRTGRTGHWLNHGKEHCLVGMKGNPINMNRGLDCDVIVAEVRATSHKPDEIYGIIERLSPGARKLELFGRPHNVQPNWITLGNQLDGVKLIDPDVVKGFKKRYPDGNCTKPKSS